MMSFGVRAAYASQPECRLHLFGNDGSSFQRSGIVRPEQNMAFSLTLPELRKRLIELRTAGRQRTESRHILRILLQEDHRSTLISQPKQFLQHIGRHQASTRHHQRFVGNTTRRQQLAIPTDGVADKGVRNVVHVITRIINTVYRLNETRRTLRHLMDIEQHQASLLLVPHVVHGQIDQKIIVRFSHLQETLAAGDVVEESRSISPDAVRGTHVDGSIKLPSRPCSLSGRVRSAVEIDMVHTGDEHQVQIGLALRKRSAEVLGQPSERFRSRERLSGDVCSRGGILKHGEVGIVGARQRIAAQSADAEVR